MFGLLQWGESAEAIIGNAAKTKPAMIILIEERLSVSCIF
jgi:hypothetical protein